VIYPKKNLNDYLIIVNRWFKTNMPVVESYVNNWLQRNGHNFGASPADLRC